MDTNALIQELANSAAPVRRLPPPGARMLIWLALSVPFLIAVIWLMVTNDIDPAATLVDRRFLLEEVVLFATALTAALGAFASVVPCYYRRLFLLAVLQLRPA